jgi:hypothetical protein
MFYRSLFVFLSFFFWPLCCLFFDLRILITPFKHALKGILVLSSSLLKWKRTWYVFSFFKLLTIIYSCFIGVYYVYSETCLVWLILLRNNLYHVIIILISFYIVFQYLATIGLITGFVTRLTRQVPLVEQELLPEHLRSPPVFSGVREYVL